MLERTEAEPVGNRLSSLVRTRPGLALVGALAGASGAGITFFVGSFRSLLVLFPLLVAAVVAISLALYRPPEPLPWRRIAFPVAAGFAIVSSVNLHGLFAPRGIAVAGGVFLLTKAWDRIDRRTAAVSLMAVSAVILGISVWGMTRQPANAIDVVALHDSASAALRAGQNPYVVAEAVETLPDGPGEPIIGYTYPPVPMLAYGLTGIVVDPRIAGLAAVIATVWLVGWPLLVGSRPSVAILLGSLVLAIPFLPQMVAFGWTEAITAPFLIASALLWRRHPSWAGVLLGIGLASKQYLVVLAPLLVAVFVLRSDFRRHLLVALGAAVAVTLPWVLLDPQAFFDATIVHHLTRPPRVDSLGLVGVGLTVPTVVAVLGPTVAGGIVGRRVATPSDLLLAMSSVLGVFALLGNRSFTNYWWLVVVLALAAVAMMHGRSGRHEP